MDEIQKSREVTTDEVSWYASNMLRRGQNSFEVKSELLKRGLDEESAAAIVDAVEEKIVAARKAKANRDMLYGALWCVGGIVLTVSNIGYIFWGAIIFGAVQFFRGVSNLS